jgi:putative ATP-dependent endonuclease of OLD family
MNILIDKVRIKNFRSLADVEVNLQALTLLVGTNNAGKTSFLRALNTVLGTSRSALNRDDLFINANGETVSESIAIDIRIIPFSEGVRKPLFADTAR